MRRFWIAVVALFLGISTLSFAPRPAAENCTSCTVGFLACERCDGKGEQERGCRRCRGFGTMRCIYCVGQGAWDCPACFEGKIRWNTGDKDSCKLCKATGKIKCAGCNGTKKVGCLSCKKTRKIKTQCVPCFGTGVFPCPTCPRPATCQLCSNTKEMVCFWCDGKGRHFKECEDCLGSKLQFCDSCAGGMIACSNCHGAGRIRYVDGNGNKAGHRPCTVCDGKGYSKCNGCKGGLAACEKEGASKKCDYCTGVGSWSCMACGK